MEFLNGSYGCGAPARRARLRGERSWRRTAPTERFYDKNILYYTIININCFFEYDFVFLFFLWFSEPDISYTGWSLWLILRINTQIWLTNSILLVNQMIFDLDHSKLTLSRSNNQTSKNNKRIGASLFPCCDNIYIYLVDIL